MIRLNVTDTAGDTIITRMEEIDLRECSLCLGIYHISENVESIEMGLSYCSQDCLENDHE